jgi:hypothetical protein
MNTVFLVIFGAMKIIFTATFVWLVLRERLSEEDSVRSLKDLFRKFIFGPPVDAPSHVQSPAWIGISREYRGKDNREDIFYERLKLSAAGEQVTGEISRTVDYTNEWKVGGFYRHDMLVLQYWHEDSQRGSGAIVVQRDDSGAFKGCWLGLDRDKKGIGAGPYIITPANQAKQAQDTNAKWLASPTYFPPVKAAQKAGG